MKSEIGQMIRVIKDVLAQGQGTSTTDFIYNKVYKNISFFNLLKNKEVETDYNKNDILTSYTASAYERFLPDCNSRLEYDLVNSNMSYPNKEYTLYEIHMDRLKYKSLSDTTETVFLKKNIFNST